ARHDVTLFDTLEWVVGKNGRLVSWDLWCYGSLLINYVWHVLCCRLDSTHGSRARNVSTQGQSGVYADRGNDCHCNHRYLGSHCPACLSKLYTTVSRNGLFAGGRSLCEPCSSRSVRC